jgi:sugar phosphate isomerase/epimerase
VAADAGRFLLAGADPAAAIGRLKDRIFAVRLTDVSPSGSFCPLGKGRVDFPSCFRALRESDYDGLLTLPCEGFPDDAEEAIAESLEYLKKISSGQ